MNSVATERSWRKTITDNIKKNVVDPAQVPTISSEGQQSAALINAEQIAELNTMLKVSAELHKSGMFPQLRNGGQVLAVVLAGKERGYGAMTSLTNIHVINGRIGYSAQMIAAELRKAGVKYNVVETDTEHCKICFERKGQDPFTYDWTTEDAKRARKLPAKPDSVWSTYIQDMLFCRCLTAGGRKFAPDALMGAYLVDELPNDSPAEPEDDPNDHRSRTEKLKDKLTNGEKPKGSATAQADDQAPPEDSQAPPGEPSPEPPEAGPQGGEIGEEEKKTAELEKFRADIKKLDQVCRNKLCPNKGTAFGAAVDAHHLIKRSQGGDNSVGNGIGLCRHCHDLVEKGREIDGKKLTGKQIELEILEQWLYTDDWRWDGVYEQLRKPSTPR